MNEKQSKNSSKKPNIVFVFGDEWRGQAVGYAGDKNCHTPVIDSFSKEGVIFTNAISGCSVCCPYRASLMTGQYPITNGVFVNDVELKKDCYSIAIAFSDNGYNTAYIGKWHLYGSPKGQYERRENFVPRDHQLGFDYWKGFECTHDYNDSKYFFNDDPTERKWEGYDAFPQSRDAADYIKTHSKDEEPFMLLLSWGPPHFPLNSAPEKYRKMYENKEIVLRPNVPEDQKKNAIRDLKGYYAHIAALDDAFKIVWDSVKESGIEDDTIFIFTSDHGDMMFSQGLEMKLFPFKESINVPFLLHYPPITGRKTSKLTVPIDAPDIMPTLLGLCGLKIPETVEGRDWSPYIKGEKKITGEETGLLNMPSEFSLLFDYGINAYRGIYSLDCTYVRDTNGPWLLFDNRKDPCQMKNLIDVPEYKTIQDDMEKRLKEKLLSIHDEFLDGETYRKRFNLTHYMESDRESFKNSRRSERSH